MSVVKRLAAPFRAVLQPPLRGPRAVGSTTSTSASTGSRGAGGGSEPAAARAQSRIDVGENDTRYGAAPFASFTSMAVDAAHFRDGAFREWFALVSDGGMELHRKPWEYAFMLERARQAAVLEPGRRARSASASGASPSRRCSRRAGLDVLATDQADEDADHWKDTGEHASDVAALSRPGVVDDATLAARVTFRAMDMNDLADDLGEFDLVWSSCAIEHLGSPAAGLEFVLQTRRAPPSRRGRGPHDRVRADGARTRPPTTATAPSTARDDLEALAPGA